MRRDGAPIREARGLAPVRPRRAPPASGRRAPPASAARRSGRARGRAGRSNASSATRSALPHVGRPVRRPPTRAATVSRSSFSRRTRARSPACRARSSAAIRSALERLCLLPFSLCALLFSPGLALALQFSLLELGTCELSAFASATTSRLTMASACCSGNNQQERLTACRRASFWSGSGRWPGSGSLAPWTNTGDDHVGFKRGRDLQVDKVERVVETASTLAVSDREPALSDHRDQHVARRDRLGEELDEVRARRNVVDVEEDPVVAPPIARPASRSAARGRRTHPRAGSSRTPSANARLSARSRLPPLSARRP